MKMKLTIMSMLAAGAMAFTAVAPASAITPVAKLPQLADVQSNVEQVRHRNGSRDGVYGNQYRIYKGHRGYRDYRQGYRRHNGYWYPRAAFGLGIIIAPGIQRRVIRSYGSNDHINWCEDRYRSYRFSDNSWKPNRGPRRVCVSPYY